MAQDSPQAGHVAIILKTVFISDSECVLSRAGPVFEKNLRGFALGTFWREI
jgi:hypothetical protein